MTKENEQLRSFLCNAGEETITAVGYALFADGQYMEEGKEKARKAFEEFTKEDCSISTCEFCGAEHKENETGGLLYSHCTSEKEYFHCRECGRVGVAI